MNIGSFIGLNLIVIFGMMILFFLFKEFYRVRNNKKSFTTSFIVGIVLSIPLFFVVAYLSVFYKDQRLWLSITLIFIIVFSIMVDKWMPLILMPTLVGASTLLINDYGNWESYVPMIEILIISVSMIAISFAKPFKHNVANISLGATIVILFSSIFNYVAFHRRETFFEYGNDTIVIILFYALSTIAVYLSFWFAEKIYEWFFDLEKSTLQDEVSFYKTSLANDLLKTKISTSKTKSGILLLFNSKERDTQKRNDILKILRQRVLEINNDAFFFKPGLNMMAVFIPSDYISNVKVSTSILNNQKERTKDDFLYEYQIIFDSLKKMTTAELNVVATLYGRSSYIFDKLISECFYVLQNPDFFKINCLILYDYKTHKIQLQEKINLIQIIHLTKKYTLRFIRTFSDGDNVFYPVIQNSSEKNKSFFNDDVFKSKRDFESLLSHLALKTLTQLKNENLLSVDKVMIYYPPTKLVNDFKIDTFINKVKKYIEPDKLIICFPTQQQDFNDNVLEVMEQLKTHDFSIALLDSSDLTKELYARIKPSYVKQSNEMTFSNTIKGDFNYLIKEKKYLNCRII